MKKNLLLTFLFVFSVSVSSHELVVKVSLSPAGSFEAKTTKLKGEIKKVDKGFTAEQLWLKVEEFKTGIDLRDEHFKKHLNFEKFPKITLSDVKASEGKGTGTLNVNEKKLPINFSYKSLSDKKIEATFKVKPSEYGLKEAKYMEIGVDDEVEIVVTVDV